jgi:hypothetical protein
VTFSQAFRCTCQARLAAITAQVGGGDKRPLGLKVIVLHERDRVRPQAL